MAIKPTLPTNINNRYAGDYTGKVKVAKVELVQGKKNPKMKYVVIHMTGKVNGTKADFQDWYGGKKKDTTRERYAETILSRALSAQASAGVELYKDEVEVEDAKKVVKKIFTNLIGKEITIQQRKVEGYDNPNIYYIPQDNEEDDDLGDEDDELEM